MNLTDDQITDILNQEDKRLSEISTGDRDEAKRVEQQKDAVKVMKIQHAKNLAQARGAKDILDALRSQITWADLQLAGADENPYLATSSPAAFCQRILDAQNPATDPVPQISVEEALTRLSKQKPSP